MTLKYSFQAELWLYQGKGAWFFVTLPKEESRQIKIATSLTRKKGWGAVRVTVVVGKMTWQTSIFPYSKTGAYILPIKAEVRKKEKITAGDVVSVIIDLI